MRLEARGSGYRDAARGSWLVRAPCSVLRACSVRAPCFVFRAPCSVLRACSVRAPCFVLRAPCMRACMLRAPCSVRGNLWELMGTCGNL